MMILKQYKLAESEAKFADLVWQNEPISSGDLVKLCAKELNWKKSTTYTVLRKLCQRGILQNKNTVVTSIINKDEFYSMQSQQFVEDTFGGSLPKFLAAFISSRKLSDKEVNQLKKLIDDGRIEETKRE
jgi:BlaI family penicillinase repressor